MNHTTFVAQSTCADVSTRQGKIAALPHRSLIRVAPLGSISMVRLDSISSVTVTHLTGVTADGAIGGTA